MGLTSNLRVLLGPHGKHILKLHNQLEGLLNPIESAWLFRNAGGKKEIVEIGSYRGKSTVLLALGSKADGGPGAHITAIDPHFYALDTEGAGAGKKFRPKDQERLREQATQYGVLDQIEEWVIPSREGSGKWMAAGSKPIDLLFIDGDHVGEEPMLDMVEFSPYVPVGGIMAMHDYGPRFPDVIRAWDAFVTPANGWGPTGHARSIAWAQRTTPARGRA